MNYEDNSVLRGQKCHYKMKSKIMRKFFDEPVDALDLRLTNLEASLTVISDPWSVRCKQERDEAQSECEVEVTSSHEVEVTSSHEMEDGREDVQFIAGSSLKCHRDSRSVLVRHVSHQRLLQQE